MPSSGVQKCALDRKSTRLNSSHGSISDAVFCLKKKHTHLKSTHTNISDGRISYHELTLTHRVRSLSHVLLYASDVEVREICTRTAVHALPNYNTRQCPSFGSLKAVAVA